VAGNAAVYFDPHNPDDIAKAIQRLLEDRELRARLVRLGDERRRQFSWQHTAAETLRSFERARGKP
jgi:glycosyltransferase involved in cell wall biosynthesis